MNRTYTALSATIAAVLASAAVNAQTLEQDAERSYQSAEQNVEQAAQEGRQETREAMRGAEQETQQAAQEIEQETQEAWGETKQETRRAGRELEQETEEAERAATGDADRTRTAARGETAGEDREEMREDAEDAREQVSEARDVVQKMKRDQQLTGLLQKARGVFILPSYGKGGAVVGGGGGEGVLLLNENGEWSNPAFYNYGRISAGAQAGGEGGSIAMLLMSDKAVKKFKGEENNWALDATAGLTIVNYSADSRASTDRGDVIVWSDTKGLFAGATVGVSNISRDDSENAAFYNQRTTPEQIFAGKVQSKHAQELRDALPQQMAGR